MDRRSHAPEGILRLVLFVLVAGAGWGCGLFDTRDPRLPDVPTERCRNLTEPDSLVANIQLHYGRLAGIGCYNSMVDTAFQFHADPVDSAANPIPYQGWNRDVETRVTSNIAAGAQFVEVVFDSSYQDPISTTSPRTETRFYAYHILFRGTAQADTSRYQGRADIKFQQGGAALWSIVDWTDHSDGGPSPTWGRLRADHRVGF